MYGVPQRHNRDRTRYGGGSPCLPEYGLYSIDVLLDSIATPTLISTDPIIASDDRHKGLMPVVTLLEAIALNENSY